MTAAIAPNGEASPAGLETGGLGSPKPGPPVAAVAPVVSQGNRYTTAVNRAQRAVRRANRAGSIVSALAEGDGMYVQITGMTAASELLADATNAVVQSLNELRALRDEGFANHAAAVETGAYPRKS